MYHYGAIPAIALDRCHARFDARYIYAGTYAHTLISKLFSEAEREKIIGSPDVSSLTEMLRETFVGAYLASSDDVEAALARALADAKQTLERLSPTPHLLAILWLRYDFYNLKVLIKHSRPEFGGASEEAFIPLGLVSYAVMERAVKSGKGAMLPRALSSALSGVPKDADALDAFMEARYLEAALAEAEGSDKSFAVRYVRLFINLFVILSSLRARARGEEPLHFPISDFSPSDIANHETMLTRLSHIGFGRHWTNAIETFRERGDFSALDHAADDFLMKWLKRQAIQIDSPAPLFAYWHVLRENIQLVRAALTAKKVAMNEAALRDIIRASYNAYAY